MVIRYGFVVQQYPRGIKFSLFTNTCLRQERRGQLLFRFPLFKITWWLFFENFRQKNLTPSLLYSRFVLNWRLNAVKYNCVLEIWVVIDCALVIFTSRNNENILFERKHFRFLVVGNLSLKWAALLVFLRQRGSLLRLAEVGVTELRINKPRNLRNPIFL